MGFRNGMVIAVPVPKEQEANAEEVTKAIETALEEARFVYLGIFITKK